jgi:type IV pilus biogenesis protein CpaD/CtpE
VHLLSYVVKCSYKFMVQHSSKLFEVFSICLDTFSDSCDQRTSNLSKHCSENKAWLFIGRSMNDNALACYIAQKSQTYFCRKLCNFIHVL